MHIDSSGNTKDYMKCPDLHRNIMFPSVSPYDDGMQLGMGIRFQKHKLGIASNMQIGR